MLRADGAIFSLEDDAELVVFRAIRSGLDVLARYEVASSPTWAQPTLAGERLYVKDVSNLTLWTLN
jgi:hypothetical protein